MPPKGFRSTLKDTRSLIFNPQSYDIPAIKHLPSPAMLDTIYFTGANIINHQVALKSVLKTEPSIKY